MHRGPLEIEKDLWQVGGDVLTTPEDAAVYLVAFGHEAAVIDAGAGAYTDILIKNIRLAVGNKMKIPYVFLTHCHFDHTGGALALAKKLKSKIVAHALEAPYLEAGDPKVTASAWYGATMPNTPVNVKITKQKTVFKVGSGEITAHHTPGHSPGSVVFTAQVNGKTVLFGQDVHGPIHKDLLSDAEAYQRSLEYLLTLDADILCEGHMGVIQGKSRVGKFIKRYLKKS